jgi:four helix bundle protein
MRRQFTNAADSISANIPEGFGRLSPKNNRRFCLIAGGSLFEKVTWFKKATKRNLINKELGAIFSKRLNDLKVKLWNDIQALKKRLKQNNCLPCFQ